MQGQAVYAVLNRSWHYTNGSSEGLLKIFNSKEDAELFATEKQNKYGYEEQYTGNSYVVEEYFLE